ncbi:hypothetical protein BH09DEP1_BH09DEP1_6230 [soil metagenome]
MHQSLRKKCLFIIIFSAFYTAASSPIEEIDKKESNSFSWIELIKSSFSSEYNYYGLQLLLIGAYEAADSITSTAYCTKGQIINPMPDFVQEISTKIGISRALFFSIADTDTIASTAEFGRVSWITLSNEFNQDASLEEKTFVVGHEMAHIKNNHGDQKDLVAVATLPLTIIAVFAIDQAVQSSISSINKRFNLKEDGYAARILGIIQKGSHIASRSPLFHWFIFKYLNNTFSRKCEREADRDAALILNSAKGGISFFKKLMLQGKKPSSPLRRMIYKLDDALGFLSHPPHAERISDLEKLI